MKKVILAAVSGVLVAAATGAAGAATGDKSGDGAGFGFWGRGGHEGGRGGHGTMMLKRLDTNHDGAVSLEEFLSPRKGAFQTLDADKSGSVAAAEVRAPLEEKAEFMTKRFMKRMDANGDGKVSKEEFEAGPKKRFADNDLNNDGTISADERPAGRHGKGGWGWGFFGGGKKDGESRGSGRAHEAPTMAAVIERTDAKFKELDGNGDGFIDATERTAAMEARIDLNVKRMMHRTDANNDGQVSEAEFLARAEKRFATLDLNGDGKIGPEDLAPGRHRGSETEKK